MEVLSFSDVRANFKAVLDHVVEDSAPVVVTRQKAEAVVMISLADWRAIAETLHLASTPANAGRLREAIRGLEQGDGNECELLAP